MWVAGAASLGAGAVHAAAIGAHAEHPQVVKTFTVLAVAQLAWGAVALVRPSRRLLAAGVAVNGAAVVGWVLAKTSGIGFIDGLETSEPTQWADGLCAALAAAAAVFAAVAVVGALRSTSPDAASSGRALQRASIGAAAVIALLSLTGMNSAASHHHEGEGHSHGDTAVAADGHAHSHDTTGADGADMADMPGMTPSAVAPVPYDPAKPIDLGGVSGVTPEQQARAENLVAVTLVKLPQFADVTTLEAKGYHSIQDGGTGHEHYVNWSFINDGRQLDPDAPESLVFEMIGGKKTLVSAMYMAEGGVDLDHVPDIGGKLTQWHIHDNLCYSQADPPRVAGLTDGSGNCPPGTRKLGNPVPMIHVWITAHRCGPFAALEGVGAGQVKAGETTQCDSAHGAHTH